MIDRDKHYPLMIDYVFKKREKRDPEQSFSSLRRWASGGKILKSFSVTQTALAKFYF